MTLCIATLDVQAQNQVKSPSKAQIRRTEKKMERLTIRDSIVLEKHHSIRIGYGAVAPFYQFRMYDPASFSVQHYYRGAESSSGIVFAEYSYRPLRWLETGLNVGYINLSRQFNNRLTDQKIGFHTLNTLSFAAHVRFSYLTRPIVRLYSGLAIGATIGFEQMKIDKKSRTTAPFSSTARSPCLASLWDAGSTASPNYRWDRWVS